MLFFDSYMCCISLKFLQRACYFETRMHGRDSLVPRPFPHTQKSFLYLMFFCTCGEGLETN